MNEPLDSSEILSKKVFEKWSRLDKVAMRIAALSFMIGTIILVIYVLSKDEGLFYIGFFYVAAALAVNTIVLIILIIDMFISKHYITAHFKSMGILLINLPISFFYFMIVVGSEGIF